VTTRLWGARFTQDMISDVLSYTETTAIDERLIEFDLWQDMVHVLALGYRDIIPSGAVRALLGTLIALTAEHSNGSLTLDRQFEDVHLNIEHKVISGLGIDVGGRLHTARSRNDQVSTDTRMYLRRAQLDLAEATLDLVDVLLRNRNEDYFAVLPGYTHGQAAQPISVAFWRTAHASMLLRDTARLRDAFSRTNESPLGGCALAGSSFNIDRQLSAQLLGFARLLTHSLDATSARDYIIETASAIAIGGCTLSRMAEEIVIWSSHEYALCEVGDAFATGSSIMPQKKNPVVAELARARAGRSTAALVQLLTAMKGVPLGYSCDLQEDKPYMWHSIDSHLQTLRVLAEQATTLQFDTERGENLCWDNFSTATELANYLVLEHQMAFRKAFQVVGMLVSSLLERGETLRNAEMASLFLEELGCAVDAAKIRHIVAPQAVLERYSSRGSARPEETERLNDELMVSADKQRQWVQSTDAHLSRARDAAMRAAHSVTTGTAIREAVDIVIHELSRTPGGTSVERRMS